MKTQRKKELGPWNQKVRRSFPKPFIKVDPLRLAAKRLVKAKRRMERNLRMRTGLVLNA